jgi:hypothetical protein
VRRKYSIFDHCTLERLNLNDNKFITSKMTKYVGVWLIRQQPVTAKSLENLTLQKQTNLSTVHQMQLPLARFWNRLVVVNVKLYGSWFQFRSINVCKMFLSHSICYQHVSVSISTVIRVNYKNIMNSKIYQHIQVNHSILQIMSQTFYAVIENQFIY